eukprot:1543743-Rhodomonas_salina.2
MESGRKAGTAMVTMSQACRRRSSEDSPCCCQQDMEGGGLRIGCVDVRGYVGCIDGMKCMCDVSGVP